MHDPLAALLLSHAAHADTTSPNMHERCWGMPNRHGLWRNEFTCEPTSLLPVFISSSVMGSRHCSGMLNRSRSEGLTPNHLMSGVVRLLLSYDMFIEPAHLQHILKLHCSNHIGRQQLTCTTPSTVLPSTVIPSIAVTFHVNRQNLETIGVRIDQRQYRYLQCILQLPQKQSARPSGDIFVIHSSLHIFPTLAL